MSDHDRGPYTPPSDRLAFDPREPVRSGGPAPVTLIVSAVVLVAIVGGVFFLYRDGFRHRGEGPAAVGEPLGAIKSPAPPDASNDMPAGLVIDKSDNSNAAPHFAPPPEEPPLPPSAVVPTAVPATPPAVTPASNAAAPPSVSVSRIPAPPAPPAVTSPVVATPAAKPVKTMTIASLADEAAAKSATVKPHAAATPTPTVVKSGPGAGWVQIGAFSSAALADKGWSDIAKLAPGAMAGKGKKVEPVSRDGKDLYRTFITGFANRDAAETFCGKLKAAGKSCFVK